MIDIKFIPTGHIFSLSDSEAERIIKEDRGNYEIIKGKIKEEPKSKPQRSVQELVVIEDNSVTNKKTNKSKSKKVE